MCNKSTRFSPGWRGPLSVIYVINVIKVLDSHLVGEVLCNLCNKCNNSTRFSPGWRGPRSAESVSYFRASDSCTSCLLGPPPRASSRSPLMPNPTVYSSALLSPETARSLHAVYELMVPSLLSPMMNKSPVLNHCPQDSLKSDCNLNDNIYFFF